MAKKTNKTELKQVEVLNNSKYDVYTRFTDDGKKVIIDVMENNWEKWRNRLAYLVIVILLITMATSCSTTTQCYNVGTGKPMQQTCGGTGWYGGQ
tara:strand:- start:336 stop:620 length:285 start_codon:yes stop_codon:yes gene_type:complete